MSELLRASHELQEYCHGRNWPFCFIDGIAVLRWGEARTTRDADITIFTGFEVDDAIVNGLLERFKPRMDGMRKFAREYRVLLLESMEGHPFDIALGGFEFEREMIKRSSPFSFDASRTSPRRERPGLGRRSKRSIQAAKPNHPAPRGRVAFPTP